MQTGTQQNRKRKTIIRISMVLLLLVGIYVWIYQLPKIKLLADLHSMEYATVTLEKRTGDAADYLGYNLETVAAKQLTQEEMEDFRKHLFKSNMREIIAGNHIISDTWYFLRFQDADGDEIYRLEFLHDDYLYANTYRKSDNKNLPVPIILKLDRHRIFKTKLDDYFEALLQ